MSVEYRKKLRCEFYLVMFCAILTCLFAGFSWEFHPFGIGLVFAFVSVYWALGAVVFGIMLLMDFCDWKGD